MDLTVLYNLSYGLYIVGAIDGRGRAVGCVINTCFQVTSQDPKIVISLNKNNYTLEAIRRTGRFALSIISENSDPNLISIFGFSTSRDRDKYADFGRSDFNGMPVPKGKFCGCLSLAVLEYVDCGTHMLVVANLLDTRKGESCRPMTYEYYHNVIKGVAPKNAPTFRG